MAERFYCLKIIFALIALFSFPSSVLAVDELYFLHTDHLDSTRVVTDRAGSKVAEYAYYPYGERQLGS